MHICDKKSHLWLHIKRLHLTTNMRVHLHGDTATGEFGAQGKGVGGGGGGGGGGEKC